MVYNKKYTKAQSAAYARKKKANTTLAKRSRITYNKQPKNQIYYFKRFTGNFGSMTIDNINTTLVAFNFSLNDLPSYTDFTNLYDCYKINAIRMTFLPQQTESVSLGSINNPNASARFFSVLDYNDSSALASVDAAREYQSCQFTPILQKHERYFKPKIMDSASVYNPVSPWISTTSPSTNYFGLKVAVEPMDSSTTTTMEYTVECVYYMSFKNVK